MTDLTLVKSGCQNINSRANKVLSGRHNWPFDQFHLQHLAAVQVFLSLIWLVEICSSCGQTKPSIKSPVLGNIMYWQLIYQGARGTLGRARRCCRLPDRHTRGQEWKHWMNIYRHMGGQDMEIWMEMKRLPDILDDRQILQWLVICARNTTYVTLCARHYEDFHQRFLRNSTNHCHCVQRFELKISGILYCFP